VRMTEEALPGLEIDEHLDTQRRGLIGDRIAWASLAVVIVSAVLGLFGNGLLGPSSVTAPGGGLVVGYDRFTRFGADSILSVRVSSDVFDGDRFSVALPLGYLDAMRLDGVSPQPLEEVRSEREITYLFAAPDSAHATVRFDITASDVGPLSGAVTVGRTGTRVSLSQFLWP
jgi:hypothetical protein